MNWRIIPALAAFLTPNPVLADTNLAPTSAASQLCRQAIMAAERAHGIPSHLLAAIARVESGRRDQASGTFNPWPWTINFDGQGSFYDSKTQAIAAALTFRAQARHSVDVGCMQISLSYHPNAFTGMDQAFDPFTNADYGARFLLSLYEKSGSWPKAVELYHSSTPDLGRDYQQKVYAAWPEEKKFVEASEPPSLSTSRPGGISGTWGLPTTRPPFSSLLHQTAPHIIPLTPGPTGGAIAGRTLDAYRAAPVRLAFRLQ